MRRFSRYLVVLVMLSFTATIQAQTPAPTPTVVTVTTPAKSSDVQQATLAKDILKGGLAGLKPSGAIKESTAATDTSLPDQPIYADYGVQGLVERSYNNFVVRIFWTEKSLQAYGLYTFYRDPMADKADLGTESDLDIVGGRISFWQGRYFVQVVNTQEDKRSAADSENLIKLATAVAESFTNASKHSDLSDLEAAKQLPSVITNLPEGSLRLRTARYILGAQTLARLLKHEVSAYEFYPNFGTEIAMATYEQGSNQLSLLIIEYHTPQQASSALAKLTEYRNSLPAAEQAKSYIKRQGNYIVEADNFSSLGEAEKVAQSVKYNYEVKWLSGAPVVANTRSITSEALKTGRILTSVFGIIGVGLISALIFGLGGGLVKFRMRKNLAGQAEAFTDAGGMVRLNLDPADGLPVTSLEASPDKKLLKDSN